MRRVRGQRGEGNSMSAVSLRQFALAGVLLSAIAGVFLSVTARPMPVDTGAPDPKTVAAAVISYHASIRSMEGRFESKMTPAPKLPARAVDVVTEDVKDSRSSVAFRTDIVHGWTHLDETRSFISPGLSESQRLVVRHTGSFNGDRTCALQYTLAESPVPAGVPSGVPYSLKSERSNLTESAFMPWHFAALRLWGVPRQSLATLFQRNLVTIDGEESVDGVKCIVIGADATAGELRMWLDPGHDYLPRKQFYGSPDGDAEFDKTLIVNKFQQYDDGSGHLRWFPKEAVVQIGFDDYSVELVELQLNVDCRQEQFTIDPETLPPGVSVHDANGSWVTGGRDDIYRKLRKLMAEQDQIMEERLRDSQSEGATVGSKENADSAGLKPK
jgi:hypothetical protein